MTKCWPFAAPTQRRVTQQSPTAALPSSPPVLTALLFGMVLSTAVLLVQYQFGHDQDLSIRPALLISMILYRCVWCFWGYWILIVAFSGLERWISDWSARWLQRTGVFL